MSTVTDTPMLQSIVTDPRHAWEGNTISQDDVLMSLSPEATEEMMQFISNLSPEWNELTFQEEGFREQALALSTVKSEVTSLCQEHVDDGPGLIVLNGLVSPEMVDFSDWNPEDFMVDEKDTDKWRERKRQLKAAVAVVSVHLGEMLLQGEDDPQEGKRLVYIKEVKDRKQSYGEHKKAHYSDSNKGGDFHTDGAEIPRLPKYLPLMCVRQAEEGGVTILNSVYPAHNRLLESNPEALARLYENYHWDKRGAQAPGEPETFEKPIFRYADGKLAFTYLRKYIQAGHDIVGAEMTEADTSALDALDEHVMDESKYLRLKLEPGQILISNNFTTIHGRPSEGYRDSETDPRMQRLLLRSWTAV